MSVNQTMRNAVLNPMKIDGYYVLYSDEQGQHQLGSYTLFTARSVAFDLMLSDPKLMDADTGEVFEIK